MAFLFGVGGSSAKAVGGFQQLVHDARLQRRMPRIRHHAQVGFRPGAMQIPGTAHRAHHVVAPLHDDRGNPADALDIAQQLVRDAGFDPVVVGGLSTAKSFDQGAPAYHTLTARELRKILGIIETSLKLALYRTAGTMTIMGLRTTTPLLTPS